MKKALQQSKLSPSRFMRRVLTRSSNVSKVSEEEDGQQQINSSVETIQAQDVKQSDLELEIESLREQLAVLQTMTANMQDDSEEKEKTLAKLAREKQQLSTELKKEKRASVSLWNQLEDERNFYYKEKEKFCQEMNECKKLKQKMSTTLQHKEEVKKEEIPELTEYKSQIDKLKSILNQTLQANYNLSLKFLRMKNTKTNLKTRLKKSESHHEQVLKDFQAKLEGLKKEIAQIVDNKLTSSISPSNKKYLQVIKQNGNLIHENLRLQSELDRLTAEVEHLNHNLSRQKDKLKFLVCSKSYSLHNEHESVQQKNKNEQVKINLVKRSSAPTLQRNSNNCLLTTKERTNRNDIIKNVRTKPAKQNFIITRTPASSNSDLNQNISNHQKLTNNFRKRRSILTRSNNNSSESTFNGKTQIYLDTEGSDITCGSTRSIFRTQSAPDISRI